MNRGFVWCPHCSQPHALGTEICPTAAKSLERNVHLSREAKQPHPLVGQTVGGKYLVLRLLGSGGTGAVFEAENRVLRRKVALKIVRGGTASAEATARLEREAALVSAVQHPNICDVYDFGTLPDGSPFIALERLFGETLGARLTRKGRMPLDLTLDVFVQMLSGLQAAHGAQIIHRDLKPQNVFLADRLGCPPLVKLLDFGFAKDVTGVRARTITKPGALLGTLRYMSPEQMRAEKASQRSDIFAVGIMLHEALAAKHPFDAASIGEFQAKLLRCEPPRLTTIRPDIPSALAEIVLRALALSPDHRYASALDLQKALARVALTITRQAHVDNPPGSGRDDAS